MLLDAFPDIIRAILRNLAFKTTQALNRVMHWFLYLWHVDGADGEGFESQDGPVLVLFPPLKHDVELVSFPFQKVRILEEKRESLFKSL